MEEEAISEREIRWEWRTHRVPPIIRVAFEAHFGQRQLAVEPQVFVVVCEVGCDEHLRVIGVFSFQFVPSRAFPFHHTTLRYYSFADLSSCQWWSW